VKRVKQSAASVDSGASQGWPYIPSIVEMKELAKHAAEIRKLSRRGISDTIEIGRRLTAAKEILVHGSFLPWLTEEFAWSESTAQNFEGLHSRRKIQIRKVYGFGPADFRVVPACCTEDA
jgi:hypothetical protein